LREVLKHEKALVFGNYVSNLGHFFGPFLAHVRMIRCNYV
jgi:hypothetical protein